MPYKTCPSCRQISYSAADSRIWFCPCCGEDLSLNISVKDGRSLIGLGKRRPGRLYEFKKRKSSQNPTWSSVLDASNKRYLVGDR